MKKWFLPILLFLSGCLFPLALAPFFYWPLGLVSLTGLVYGLRQAHSGKQAFLHSWLYSTGQFLVGVSWIYVSMQRFGGTPMPLAALAVVLFAMFLALIPASVFALRQAVFGHTLAWLTLPVFWFFSEWVRGHLLTGFPWLFAGDAHLFSWLSGYAPLISSYGLSMLVVLTITVIWQAVQTKHYAYLTLLLFWPFGAYLQNLDWTEKVGELTVSAVQGNVAQKDKWLPSIAKPTIANYYQQTAKHWDSDLILWPETAVTLLYDQFKPYMLNIADEAKEHQSTVITGIAYRYPRGHQFYGEFHNSITAFGNGEGLYHKQKLVPFGEFVPFETQIRGLLPFFDLEMSSFKAGDANQALLKVNKANSLYLVAPFICYEIAYSEQVASMAAHADLLITVSNDAWFGDSLGPKQHMALAQMRALETGRYLLRATNTGITALVNNKGQIIARLPYDVRDTLTGNAEMRQGSTPFMRFGLWPLHLFSALILLAAFILRKRNYG
ncbi:MAG: apolipoprotein N-acyltransferase [Venatoribacter sp.]